MPAEKKANLVKAQTAVFSNTQNAMCLDEAVLHILLEACQGPQQQLPPQVASKDIPKEEHKSVPNHFISLLWLTHVV
jgi:hypothetical protein